MKYIFLNNNGDYVSDLIYQFKNSDEIKIIFCEKQPLEKINLSDKFYLPSDTIYLHIKTLLDGHTRNVIDQFRDKYQFRKKLAKLFPEFDFDKVSLKNLKNYQLKRAGKHVIKPMVGFMGAGARIIDEHSDLEKIADEITKEIVKFSEIYPDIFSSEMIIEQYIEGDNEYAVDMYYNEEGKPVIVNIYCHPQAKRKEYLQMLYYTNKNIFDNYYMKLVDFFTDLNKTINVKSFPIHAEFKLDTSHRLIPIEFNSCRFGGMGLADLTYYAFNFNPLSCYFENSAPNWATIWATRADTTYCWVLAYNGADIDVKKLCPNHAQFKKLLPQTCDLLAYKELDHRKSAGFALAYLSTKNQVDIGKILGIEFNECFCEKIIL